MSSANDIIQELRELDSQLAAIPRTMPYEVPVGYFEGLADVVLSIAKNEEPQLHLPKVMP